ncbi:ABC transporter transmembrane domain-containing protein [Snodgrassella alvi]|uniref:ABC transporter transmembrane domain-containing protein n=1 Tax=Snodgrassella alvi TaxID=1196083 RepID=UPI001FD0527D|nr:ABC transporter ATP-binding protein [Snodgrassella alvi]UOO99160.1 ABC transporter ATP-binding protein/permease [Snodgrassella alvi wkB2]
MKPCNNSPAFRLWQLTFKNKILIILSCLFSVLSVATAFIPFISVYYIVYELIMSLANKDVLNNGLIIHYGWLAFIAAALSLFFNFLALCFSHIAAFKTLYYLKYNFVRYLSYLPLGFYTEHSSGELRKIVDDDIEKIEIFIAHQLPDMVGSFATPIIILIILAVFDWRLGLATLVPIILAYIVLISGYRRKDIKNHMQEFQNRLIDMSNASVEYIRGIAVVKAFNQTFSSHLNAFMSQSKRIKYFALSLLIVLNIIWHFFY